MSRKRKRVTTKQQMQRVSASHRSSERRKVIKIIDLLEELQGHVRELEKLNCPPVRYPVGRSASIIEIGAVRSNDGDEDPAINRFLATLELDLILRIEKANQLRRKS